METYTIFQLGDQAITFSMSNVINEEDHVRITSMNRWIKEHSFPGLLDCIIAYSSLTIIYDSYIVKRSLSTHAASFEFVREKLKTAYEQTVNVQHENSDTLIRIPVCYEEPFSPDLEFVSEHNKIDRQTVVDLHIAGSYRVYMIGFLPGFPYLAEVDKRIAAPRKEKPRLKVAGGSVGIAGIQTGIYPVDSPGGWQIIGRTPLKMFRSDSLTPVKLESGDKVNFYAISKGEFENLSNQKQ